ncbi:MAG: YggS family pyridoxal phosphate-dependent enzyme [Olsenella sp.]|jgi:pyridoxal phosphate enzyme (YggS family)|nr:YggS family pyridoxal phosphate-dependent enzyme [Olsenella sp.]MCI1644874.1 YggS family pyridoxal phosphate-dependent enzyme [Olsenella sp.]MCI1792706.1 YggS family pyridoxal phosphate-dependent enzyme [Olsenella sp.]MCI1879392.1 YggS family pyridoxal phosphate-dependent enzyme [Olsenella sp.]MCI2127008.1 YggS family pyridoxal phosphate-dependent enzyme [Olsenella sp.]
MDETEDESYAAFLVKRREEILQRIAEAAARAGRNPAEVELLAVSKTVDVPQVDLAWRAGYRAFGENRPQELVRKLDGISAYPEMAGVRFDMIGHLQTNKVREVVGNVTLIHSVSSLHLAEAISKRGVGHNLTSDVLLEVNVSGEESKSGFSPDEVRASFGDILALPALRVHGLMTMAPAHDMDVARRTFSGLRELRDELAARVGLELPVLSCGMSDDFPIAVEEGSTIVRLGRTVFDPRYVLG